MICSLPSLRSCWPFLFALALVAATPASSQPDRRVARPVAASDSATDVRLVADGFHLTSASSKGNKAAPTPSAEASGEQQIIISPEVVRLAGVNSAVDRDNTPLVSADGSILFFNSTRQAERPWAKFNTVKQRFDDDIYFSTRVSGPNGEERWSEPINVGPEINSSEDDGIVAISPDGQALYFNSLKKGWDQDGGPFYRAKLSGVKWTDIQGLGGGITQFFKTRQLGNRYRIYGGSISSDAKDFYFATTVHSDNGKHQIWVSHWDGKEWGYPENLGPEVNAGGGSYAPCIAADGRTLYYTAGGREGYGGDDIFVSVYKDGKWGAPFNVGAPINTAGDDAFISLSASGEKAYLSRTIDNNEDLYVAPIPVISRPSSVMLLSGIVSDKENGKPLEATIVIEDLQTGKKIFNASSNSLTGSYTTVLQPGHDYGISISAPGYVFHSARYTIPSNVAYDKLGHDFQLQKLAEGEKFVANNIFFDYNTATLSPESRPELDRIVEMMKEHPQLKIQVDGHTDNIGSADYNNQLSLKRAESVKEYIISGGEITPDRITTQGFGFRKPIAPNKSEEGRKQNRRSEFTILQL